MAMMAIEIVIAIVRTSHASLDKRSHVFPTMPNKPRQPLIVLKMPYSVALAPLP